MTDVDAITTEPFFLSLMFQQDYDLSPHLLKKHLNCYSCYFC